MKKILIVGGILIVLAVLLNIATAQPISPFVIRFLDLIDVAETSFVGEAGEYVRVNAGETGLEFVTLAGGGDFLADGSVPMTDALDMFNDATPTTNVTGELALDTTIADHQPLFQYYDGGENMTIIAIDTAELPALDNEIPTYDAGTDKFVLEVGAGGGDITGVGPGALAAGDVWTDGYVTAGTDLLIWEGTSDDDAEFSIVVPADPGADIVITMPVATATLNAAGDITGTDAGTDLTADLEEEVTAGSLADDTINDDDINWANITNLDAAGLIIVADTADATSFVALWESASGSLAAKSDAALLYDAATGTLAATEFSGGGSSLTGITDALALTIYVRADENIKKGQAVYLSGSTGAAFPNIALADADDVTKIRVLGIAAADIAGAANGYVRIHGLLEDVDTEGITDANPGDEDWDPGQALYLSTTAGGLTETPPTTGRVIRMGYSLYGDHNTDDLVVAPHTNPTYITGAPTESVYIRVGDEAGANKLSILDNANTEVAAIDSDGAMQLDSNLTIGADADVDYSITFDGDTSDGILNYDEDNADFEFNQDIASTGNVGGLTVTQNGQTMYDADDVPGGSLGGTWAAPSIDDLFILLGGDVATAGDYDFGSANVDLEIPQTSPAVPDVDGQIEYDFTDGKLVMQHSSGHAELGGSTDVALTGLIKSWGGTIFEPDGINDVMTVKAINSIEFPHGVVITAVYLGVSEDSDYTLTVQNFDDFDTINGVNPTIDTVAYSNDTTGEIIDTTPTYATIAAGQIIMISIPATDVAWIHFEIYYYEPAA